MDPKSLKSLLEAVASFGRGKLADRRSGRRVLAHGLVIIRQDVQEADAETVTLLDISTHGFSFRTGKALAPEQRILAGSRAECFEAVVRHVQPDGEEFIIGAEILSSAGEPVEAGRNHTESAEVIEEP